MKTSARIVFICILLCIFSISVISPFALEDIESTLGEKTTKAMLSEIKNKINKYSTITHNDVAKTIKETTTLYGLDLSDEQIQEIYIHISGDITANITDKISFVDRVKMFIDRLYQIVEDTFPSVKGKEVVVTIPRMSQVDEWVNEGIHYIRINILPLIFS